MWAHHGTPLLSSKGQLIFCPFASFWSGCRPGTLTQQIKNPVCDFTLLAQEWTQGSNPFLYCQLSTLDGNMARWPGRVSAGLGSISTTQVGLPVPYLLSTDGCFARVCTSEVNNNHFGSRMLHYWSSSPSSQHSCKLSILCAMECVATFLGIRRLNTPGTAEPLQKH